MATTAAPHNSRVETVTIQRLTVDLALPCAEAVRRFRSLVPPIRLADLRAQTSPDGIAQVIGTSGTPSGFVLFAEYDHGGWMRYFAPFATQTGSTGDNGPGVHRLLFGNPLWAITVLREDPEAALHVPLDCAFVRQAANSTRMIMLLPGDLLAARAEVADHAGLRRQATELQNKVFALLDMLVKGDA